MKPTQPETSSIIDPYGTAHNAYSGVTTDTYETTKLSIITAATSRGGHCLWLLSVSAARLHPEAFGVAVIRRPPFPRRPGRDHHAAGCAVAGCGVTTGVRF